jgi:TM2 domain-containing membrane protein YozV
MFCPKCGRQAADDEAFCAGCGASLSPPASPSGPMAPAAGISPKSRLTATLLCSIPALFGMFGIHRVYIGKVGTGVTMIVLSVVAWITVWVLIGIPIFIAMLVWAIIDFANIVTGRMTDSDGLLIEKW